MVFLLSTVYLIEGGEEFFSEALAQAKCIIISPQADACLNALGIVTKKQALPHNTITPADIDLLT
jgi:hypothetical protein